MKEIPIKPIKIIGIAVMIFLVSCSTSADGNSRLRPAKITFEASDEFKPQTINNIAILPLTYADNVQTENTRLLDSLLNKTFSNHTSFEIVSVKKPDSVFGSEVIARRLCKSNDLQGVIFGTVHAFQGEVQNEYTEAAVDISLSIYDAASDSIVWTVNFRDKFQPLSNNLFQLPRALSQGFKAPTSVELATDGFTKAAKDLESRRNRKLLDLE